VKRFGEKKTLYTGQFFGACGMIVAGLARTGAWLFGSIPIISLWNVSMPAAQSIATRRVSEQEQGELQGAFQSMRSITFIIGPVLFLQTFRWFIDPKKPYHLPGAPWFLAGALLFTAMIMATRLRVADARIVAPSLPPEEPETVPGSVPSGVAEPPTM
jgi:MFS transporter, DHA1 family, tetracycline resistance protein